MTRMTLAAAIAIAAGTCVASADTLTLRFENISGGGSATKVRVANRTVPAGQLNYEIKSGSQTGQRLSTFCIDLSQNVKSGDVVYEIADLTDAPMPGASYTQAQADAVSAVLANAISIGWINGQLAGDTAQTSYLARMGAIQAAIWEALGDTLDLNDSNTNSGLRDAYGVLMDQQTFNDSLRVSGLRSLLSSESQDLLYVVPLPPAAFAGMGMLAACFGVRAVRRR